MQALFPVLHSFALFLSLDIAVFETEFPLNKQEPISPIYCSIGSHLSEFAHPRVSLRTVVTSTYSPMRLSVMQYAFIASIFERPVYSDWLPLSPPETHRRPGPCGRL